MPQPQGAHIFVSHNSHDVSWCHTFVAVLRQAGADVWYDEHNLGYGQLMTEIERELRDRPIFIVVLSPAAVASKWVQREVNAAIHLADQDTQRIVLPVVAERCEIPLFWDGFKRICGPNDNDVQPTDAAEQVIRIFGLVPALVPTAPIPPADAETKDDAFERGAGLYAQQRYDEALLAFDRMLALDRHDALAWTCRGNVLDQLHRPDEAFAAYDCALLLDHTYTAAWEGKGVSLYQAAHYEEALASFNQAITLAPEIAALWSNKGNALRHLNRYEDALVAYDQALVLDPYLAAAWNNKALALLDRMRYEEALVALDRQLALKPDDAAAWDSKGVALAALKRYEEALAAYDHALSLDSQNANLWWNAAIWNNKGMALAALKRYEEALVAYDRALSLTPLLTRAWNNKIALLTELGRRLEAHQAEQQRDNPRIQRTSAAPGTSPLGNIPPPDSEP